MDKIVNEVFEKLERKVRKALGMYGTENKSIHISFNFWRPRHDGHKNVWISYNFEAREGCEQKQFKTLPDLDKWATDTIRRRRILFKKFRATCGGCGKEFSLVRMT